MDAVARMGNQQNNLALNLQQVDTGAVVTRPAPEAYAAAFDPNQGMYSVNTGNASVRQMEDLSASFFSAAPAADNSGFDFTPWIMGAGILFGLSIMFKGKVF